MVCWGNSEASRRFAGTILPHCRQARSGVKRNEQLDGIRGVAIVCVVVVHMAEVLFANIPYSVLVSRVYRLMYAGWLGVDVFFVLSGFLITRILLSERERPEYWSRFYRRRGSRILPAFLAVLAVVVAILKWTQPQVRLSWGVVLPAVFFLENWTVLTGATMPLLEHAWSLAVEEQYYLVWPLLAWKMPRRWLLGLSLGLVGACELMRAALAARHAPAAVVYALTPTRMDGIALGSALALGMQMPRARLWLIRNWRWAGTAAGLGWLACYLGLHGTLTALDVRAQILAIPPVIALTAVLIFASEESLLPRRLGKPLESRALTYLGRRSYGLYLIHYPVSILIIQSRLHGALGGWPAGLAVNAGLVAATLGLTLLLAEMSFRLLEAPAMRWGHRANLKLDAIVAAE